jgi:glycine C-acetyltransferase
VADLRLVLGLVHRNGFIVTDGKDRLLEFLGTEATHLGQAGLLRPEPVLDTPQGPTITIDNKDFLNLASSDYLGLTNHPWMKKAAIAAIESWGLGLGTPRMAAGTLRVHVDLEQAIAKHLGAEDALVFSSGYHADTGLLESLLSDRDYVFADEQLRPSLADGVRLCRARVYSYRHQDLNHLEDRLKRSRTARFRVVATDGVFPLSGRTAQLSEIYSLAEKYGAIVAVDDSHGVGVLGENGRGTHHHLGVADKLELVTGTLGHALGGFGGFVAGKRQIIAWLRQKSRPYLASAALPPSAAAAALKALELLRNEPKLLETLRANVRFFRSGLAKCGFSGVEGREHPAVAVAIGDAVSAQRLADLLYRRRVFALGFCHPVVPEGAARIRAQITVRHTEDTLRTAIEAFSESAKELKLAAARPA